MRISLLALAAVLVLHLPGDLAGQTGGKPAATSPGVRNGHLFVHDSTRDMTLLFGGADAESVRGDLWGWDGRTWTLLATDGPAPRTFAASAYDSRRGTLFLYGGNRVLFGRNEPGDPLLDDLWRWDGSRWSLEPARGPGTRAEAAMAYDAGRDRLVLFGGYRFVDGKRIRLGDTWEWDGAAWLLASTSGPTGRNGSALAYDARRGVTVLFGGSDGKASGETWEWNGRHWTLTSEPLTEPRYNTVMTYDPVRGRILRFGGWNGQTRLGDTWEYDGERWIALSLPGPPARNHSAMTWDSRRRRVLLAGGHDGTRVFGDVWEWFDGAWHEAWSIPAETRVENGH